MVERNEPRAKVQMLFTITMKQEQICSVWSILRQILPEKGHAYPEAVLVHKCTGDSGGNQQRAGIPVAFDQSESKLSYM